MHAHRNGSPSRARTCTFSGIVRRARSAKALVLKAWRFKILDLGYTTEMLKHQFEVLDHERARSTEIEAEPREPLDDLWCLFLAEATPGTRMWREMWKNEPHIQRLTIADMLVAVASAKLDATLEVLMRPMSPDASEALTPEVALALAASHLDAAEEALTLAKGLANSGRLRKQKVPRARTSDALQRR